MEKKIATQKKFNKENLHFKPINEFMHISGLVWIFVFLIQSFFFLVELSDMDKMINSVTNGLTRFFASHWDLEVGGGLLKPNCWAFFKHLGEFDIILACHSPICKVGH